jgi:glycosyltransferase involved in cell wall biosynthesis
MARLISALAGKHAIMLLTYEAPAIPSFYPLPPNVERTALDLLGGRGVQRLSRLAHRMMAIRRIVRAWRPDVVLSFMDTMNITAVLSCLGSGVPVVVSERVDPSRHPLPWPKKMLRLAAYGMAHAVVVQTERIRRAFPSWLRRRMTTIPNGAPLPPSQARPDVPGRNGRFRVIGLGRLEPQKGFDLLIEAFAAVAPRHPDWDLIIFGEGNERAALTLLSERMGIAARVRLAGLTTCPEEEMTASHVIAFPSRYEGFPNALAEGVAAGLPAVAQIGVSGVEELIVNGRTGFLVGDGVQGLADALDRLMSNPALRIEMGYEARRHATHWVPDDIHARWAAVLTAAAGKDR